MKVYLLVAEPPDYRDSLPYIMGVFSSRENAENYLRNRGYDADFPHGIYEWTVDE